MEGIEEMLKLEIESLESLAKNLSSDHLVSS